MEIVEIYPPYIYSIKYDQVDENEYDRLFDMWYDMAYVVTFMENNREFLKNNIWCKISEPEDAAKQVSEEADILYDLFEQLYEHTLNGQQPDFNSHFKNLDGKYKYEIERIPVKSYGSKRPSLLRIYAIKLKDNMYLITGGGIKLADTIQNSPDLKDHVIQDIDKVRKYLYDNGIIDQDDLQ